MRKLFILSLILCMTLNMACISYAYEIEPTLEVYNGNQPINRELLDKNQARETIQSMVQSDNLYDDPYLDLQWAITQTSANLAWESTSSNNEIVVAVIDTGVDYTHEDLENRVLYDLGYDFVNKDSDAMDDYGHGTHVAGIIAAEANNGVGISGIAGDLDVSILPIKVLDETGSGETANIVAGILYAIEMNVDIINLSLGADVITPTIRMAVEKALDADIFVVVAAGNDGTECTTLSLANLDGVFTVSASTANDTIAYFSNYGDCVDAYAPGENILSTYLNNEYAYQDGTSMAAPIVSGAAAILLSQNSNLTVSQLTTLLKDTDTTNNEKTTQDTPMTSPTPSTPSTPSMPSTPTTPSTPSIPVVPSIPVMPSTPIIITQPIIRAHATNNNMRQVQTTQTTSCNTINIYQALMSLY